MPLEREHNNQLNIGGIIILRYDTSTMMSENNNNIVGDQGEKKTDMKSGEDVGSGEGKARSKMFLSSGEATLVSPGLNVLNVGVVKMPGRNGKDGNSVNLNDRSIFLAEPGEKYNKEMPSFPILASTPTRSGAGTFKISPNQSARNDLLNRVKVRLFNILILIFVLRPFI